MTIRRSKPAPLTIDQIAPLACRKVADALEMGQTLATLRSQIASEDGFGGWSPTWAAHRHEATCPSHEDIRAEYNRAAAAELDRLAAL